MTSVFVLGLDISLTSTGYAVAEVFEDGTTVLKEQGRIRTYAKDSDGVRLKKIKARLDILFDLYDIKYVTRERGFTKGNLATQQIFKATGVCEMAVAEKGIEHIEQYAPTTIKKYLGGHGRASKDDVAKGVLEYFPNTVFESDDVSDAIAVILTYLKDKGVIL
jgi:crossover junction endodeoxyribonuclease RuvC